MKHQCQLCEQRFTSKEALFNHTLHHEGTTLQGVPCAIDGCGVKFHNYNSLLSHNRRFHLIRWQSLQTHSVCKQNPATNDNLPCELPSTSTQASVRDGDCDLAFTCEPSISDREQSQQLHAPPQHAARSFDDSFAMFTLKLEAKHLLPTSVIQELLEDVTQLHKLSQDIIREELITKLSPGHSEQVAGHVDSILRADPFACILSCQGSLRSRYMRKRYYHTIKKIFSSLNLWRSHWDGMQQMIKVIIIMSLF